MPCREWFLGRFWIDPKRCLGTPRIGDHRILVSLVLDLLASNMPAQEVLEQ